MYRKMAKYTMSPAAMCKWLDQLPELFAACEAVEEDVIFENHWTAKDRTSWFHIRALRSEEANRRFVDQLLASEWGSKYASLMDEHEHTTWELEPATPVSFNR